MIPRLRGKLLLNLAFWDRPAQKVGNKNDRPNFYIRLSPQQDRSKLRNLVMWIEWFSTFQNKLCSEFLTLLYLPISI